MQVQESRGCRLPPWRKAPLSSSDYCSVTWRVLGFTILFCVILYYGSPGYFFFSFWTLGFHLRDWESPNATELSIVASQTGICFLFFFVSVLHLIRALLSFQWGAVKNQDCQILRCSRRGVMCICIVDGRGCTISDIFWSTWHIVLWSPEDWESGRVLPYPISGFKWLYQKWK